ncbi:hypothetical protein BDZ91DRAFT_736142 [Kalaharituber pfeilii]|nr:hypothetical protein BDZ91DRAFT_736142 [Kalaharituber pfeilii]
MMNGSSDDTDGRAIARYCALRAEFPSSRPATARSVVTIANALLEYFASLVGLFRSHWCHKFQRWVRV